MAPSGELAQEETEVATAAPATTVAAPPEPAARALCPDGACVGVIGDDGRCRVCGGSGTAATAPSMTCALCQASFATGTGALANGRPLCASCTTQVELDLAAERTSSGVLLALALGLVGAIAGAAVWAGIAIATDFEVGYVAVLVGFLAGYGVRRGAGRGRTLLLRGIAVGCAVLGLLLAKFIIIVQVVAAAVLRQDGIEVPYFDTIWFKVVWELFPDTLTPFDALWLFLAIGAAARQLTPTPTNLVRETGS